jgi:adenine phosphoribosyltransferase
MKNLIKFNLLSILLITFSMHSRIIKIAIASQNTQKVEAVKEIFNQKFSNVNDKLEFLTHKSDSMIPEQPVGIETATAGARNRLNSLPKDIIDSADYAIAIENYIEQSKIDNNWNDIGLVLLKEKDKTQEIICLSQPTLVPEIYVKLAQEMSAGEVSEQGYSVTAAQAIAKSFTHKNIDAHDWQKEIEFGGISRQKLLKDALYKAANNDKLNLIKNELKIYENFPKPGITFIDFLPILANPITFATCIDLLAEHYKNQNIDAIVGLESRGFILAAALALKLNASFVPVRKPGKLPCAIHSFSYKKEYGSDTFTIAQNSLTNKRVLIIDDLIATGGSARAAIELVKLAGGTPVEFITILQVKELAHLTKLGIPSFNLID